MVCYERKRKNSHFLNLWDSKQWAWDNAVEGNESERECDKSWVFFFSFSDCVLCVNRNGGAHASEGVMAQIFTFWVRCVWIYKDTQKKR